MAVSYKRGLIQCIFIHPFKKSFQLIVIFILDGITCHDHHHTSFTSSFLNHLCGDPSIQQIPDRFTLSLHLLTLQALPYQLDHQFIVASLPQLFLSLQNKHDGHTHHCHLLTQQLLHFNKFLMDSYHSYVFVYPECFYID